MALITNIKAYWKLDESSGNAADATGNGFTLTNTNTVAYNSGKINNGADFGTNTNKELLTTSSFGINFSAGDWTVSFWMNGNGTTNANNIFGAITFGGTNAKMLVSRDQANNRWEFYNGAAEINQVVAWTNGSWYHLCITKSGTTQTYYVNGSSIGTTTTAPSGVATNTMELGNSYGNFASGKIDEVGLWSRALSSAEVLQLYNGGAGIQYPFVSSTAFLNLM